MILHPITHLKDNEVFVFGSNSTGFHGAGAAGSAFRGESKNTWRGDEKFLLAMSAPSGSYARIGKWAVYGKARGFQEGHEGKSYAIETIKNPGNLRSTTLREIYYQLVELVEFMSKNPQWTFIITQIGEQYAGYSEAEMAKVWDTLKERKGIPENARFVRLPKGRKEGS